ncbi:MAG TPA: ATP-grasp domain-containing protein [Abditibacterium sp.]|jgi:hypothetical protein
MTVYIQKVGGEFSNINYFTAWQGFIERGAHVEFFASEELESLPISPETPVVAGIPVVHRALRHLGCEVPQFNAIPSELSDFAGRKVWQMTLAEVRAHIQDESGPIFIKPLPQNHKLFSGHVVSRFRDLIETAGIEPQTPVSCSEVVEIVAEYRGFVHHGELVGCKHYAGDFRVFPDFSLAETALRGWKEAPVACSMDWGVTNDGRTLLIEVNDAYSLGCYGLQAHIYAPMIADRWFQITGSSARA